MKSRYLVLAAFAFQLVGCSAVLEKTLEGNPDIVFNVIKKNPKRFIEVVNEAARGAQEDARKNEEQEEKARMDEEFKNPKKPKIEENRVVFGPKTASITIVEYSDFQCPYCSKGYENVKEVRKIYGDKVRLVYKHLPLEGHPKAMPAAKYFEALALQVPDKVEKFHDEIFTNQAKLNEKGEDFLKEVAKKLGANMSKLAADLDSEIVKAKIAADMEEARQFGFNGTPGFLINGVSLRGAYPPPYFKTIIDRQLGEGQK